MTYANKNKLISYDKHCDSEDLVTILNCSDYEDIILFENPCFHSANNESDSDNVITDYVNWQNYRRSKGENVTGEISFEDETGKLRRLHTDSISMELHEVDSCYDFNFGQSSVFRPIMTMKEKLMLGLLPEPGWKTKEKLLKKKRYISNRNARKAKTPSTDIISNIKTKLSKETGILEINHIKIVSSDLAAAGDSVKAITKQSVTKLKDNNEARNTLIKYKISENHELAIYAAKRSFKNTLLEVLQLLPDPKFKPKLPKKDKENGTNLRNIVLKHSENSDEEFSNMQENADIFNNNKKCEMIEPKIIKQPVTPYKLKKTLLTQINDKTDAHLMSTYLPPVSLSVSAFPCQNWISHPDVGEKIRQEAEDESCFNGNKSQNEFSPETLYFLDSVSQDDMQNQSCSYSNSNTEIIYEDSSKHVPDKLETLHFEDKAASDVSSICLSLIANRNIDNSPNEHNEFTTCFSNSTIICINENSFGEEDEEQSSLIIEDEKLYTSQTRVTDLPLNSQKCSQAFERLDFKESNERSSNLSDSSFKSKSFTDKEYEEFDEYYDEDFMESPRTEEYYEDEYLDTLHFGFPLDEKGSEVGISVTLPFPVRRDSLNFDSPQLACTILNKAKDLIESQCSPSNSEEKVPLSDLELPIQCIFKIEEIFSSESSTEEDAFSSQKNVPNNQLANKWTRWKKSKVIPEQLLEINSVVFRCKSTNYDEEDEKQFPVKEPKQNGHFKFFYFLLSCGCCRKNRLLKIKPTR